MSKSLEVVEALNDLKDDNALLSRKQAHLIYDYINKLENENQELKQMNKTLLIHNTEFSLGVPEILKENQKLKKAIEILKKYLFLADEKSLVWNESYEHSTEVSDEDYDLLKEVLENEN